jgi:hypothetical protein
MHNLKKESGMLELLTRYTKLKKNLQYPILVLESQQKSYMAIIN